MFCHTLPEAEDTNYSIDPDEKSRFIVAIIVLAFLSYYGLEEGRKMILMRSSYFLSFWNFLDLSSCCLVLATMVLYYSKSDAQWLVASIAVVLLYLRIISFVRGSPALGPFVRMLIQISMNYSLPI